MRWGLQDNRADGRSGGAAHRKVEDQGGDHIFQECCALLRIRPDPIKSSGSGPDQKMS